MSETLEGSYYEAGKQGYVNKGKEIIKFTAKVNHLPVHSRCNMLLKCEQHNLKIVPQEKLQAIHCYHSAEIGKSKSSTVDKKEIFNSNIFLTHKPTLPKIYKYESQNPEENKEKCFQSSPSMNNLTERNYYQTNSRRPSKSSQSPRSQSRQPSSPTPNQFTSKNKKKQIQKSLFSKNPLKHTFSPVSLENSPQQLSQYEEQIKIQTKQVQPKKIDSQGQASGHQDDVDECITEHAVYQHHKNNNYKISTPQKHTHEQMMLKQLSSLLKKVGRLEEKIKLTEQDFVVKNLENQINKSNTKIAQLNQQNLKLKQAHSYSQGCSGCCRKSNLHQSQGFIYFIIFMIGILFTKAALC